MKVNPLPPQAYTKETLQKAYAWLLTQSASVKDMATTQDMLVSLYLKAQRNGEAALETPSIQNFKKELKNIATMISDLQPAEELTIVQPHAQPQKAYSHPTINDFPIEPTVVPTPTTVAPKSPNTQLDPHSLQILNEVKLTLNLSSETEALRALISLGYKQFKKMN